MNRKSRVREPLRAKLKAAPRLHDGAAAVRAWAAALSPRQFTSYVTLRDITAVQRLGYLNTKLMQKSVSDGDVHSAANIEVPLLTATELCTLRGF